MFVHLLSQQEKMALVALLVSIVRKGAEITPPQEAFLSAYAADLDVPLNLNYSLSINDACANIQSYMAKVITLQEIITIALTEGCYEEHEKEGVLVIADCLKIPFETFESIESWVAEGVVWAYQGEELLSPDMS